MIHLKCLTFISSHFPVASHFAFTLKVTAAILAGATRLCDLPSLRLFSLIFLLLHSSHSLCSFVLSISWRPQSGLPSFNPLPKCHFLKEISLEQFILSNFTTFPSLLPPSFCSTNHNLIYYTFMSLWVYFYFSPIAYTFHESRNGVSFTGWCLGL